MRKLACMMLLAACGATEPERHVSTEASPLERCLANGGVLEEVWSVSNQHGAITSIAANSLIVVGSEDGSVKQWSFDGDEPIYGSPFTTGGDEVGAVAFAVDGHILAATMTGTITEWRLTDAAKTRSGTIGDARALNAVAMHPDGTRLVAGGTELYAFDHLGGPATRVVSDLWRTWAVHYAARDQVFAAGHFYNAPRIERRSAAAPAVLLGVWDDQLRQGHVRAIDIDTDANVLVAAAEGFVAVFAPEALDSGPLALTEEADHDATGATLLPTSELFVTAGSEGSLKVWRTATAELVASVAIPPAAGLARDPDGTRLFTAGPDGRVHAFGCR